MFSLCFSSGVCVCFFVLPSAWRHIYGSRVFTANGFAPATNKKSCNFNIIVMWSFWNEWNYFFVRSTLEHRIYSDVITNHRLKVIHFDAFRFTHSTRWAHFFFKKINEFSMDITEKTIDSFVMPAFRYFFIGEKSNTMKNDYDAIRAQLSSLALSQIIRLKCLLSILVFIVTSTYVICCAKLLLFCPWQHSILPTINTNICLYIDKRFYVTPRRF